MTFKMKGTENPTINLGMTLTIISALEAEIQWY